MVWLLLQQRQKKRGSLVNGFETSLNMGCNFTTLQHQKKIFKLVCDNHSCLGCRPVGSLYRAGVRFRRSPVKNNMVCPLRGLDNPPQPLSAHGQTRKSAAVLQSLWLASGPVSVGGVRLGGLCSRPFLWKWTSPEDSCLHHSTTWHPETEHPLRTHLKHHRSVLANLWILFPETTSGAGLSHPLPTGLCSFRFHILV